MIDKLLVVVLVFLVLFCAVAVVDNKHQSRNLYASLQVLKNERDELNIEWRRLLLEQATWVETGRIQAKAMDQLHMRVPTLTEVVVVKP